MKFPWSKKATQLPAPVQHPKRNSFFSTEITTEELNNLNWGDVIKQSFQRLPGNFKAVDASGKEIEDYKGLNAFPGAAQYAMDTQSKGNVLAFKPLLDPIATVPYAQLAWYASKGFVGYQICGMLAQHWFIDKVCTVPARDAMRHGYELTTDDETEIDPKVLSFIRKRDKAFGIKKSCVEFVKFNRVFGIRIALPIIETTDKEFYLKPFDIETIKPDSYKGIAQIDPYWITPELDFEAAANPASIHFYEPTWWRVNGMRIHRTHLIIIRNGQVVDVLKPTYYYGGIPVPQKVAERVYAAERTANETPQLAMTKRTMVWKMDMTQALSNLTNFLDKMNFFSQNRDNFGVKAIGLEDDVEQLDTSLTDLDDVTMTQYTIACAAADCRTAKIMGTSPKGGLGSEGEYDLSSDKEFLESLQANDMQPLLERHHMLLLASEVRPKFGSKVPEDWEPVIKWNPCDTPGAKEQAEINEIKSRVGNNLVNSGAIDGTDERNRLIMDKDSGYDGLGDREPEVMDLSGEEDTTGGIKSDKSEAGEKS